jgi:hybrid cluster-associated redox disulfide protein
MDINKDTNIHKLLQNKKANEIFKRLGLKCIDCVAAEKETLWHAAAYHKIALDMLLGELKRSLSCDTKKQIS